MCTLYCMQHQLQVSVLKFFLVPPFSNQNCFCTTFSYRVQKKCKKELGTKKVSLVHYCETILLIYVKHFITKIIYWKVVQETKSCTQILKETKNNILCFALSTSIPCTVPPTPCDPISLLCATAHASCTIKEGLVAGKPVWFCARFICTQRHKHIYSFISTQFLFHAVAWPGHTERNLSVRFNSRTCCLWKLWTFLNTWP